MARVASTSESMLDECTPWRTEMGGVKEGVAWCDGRLVMRPTVAVADEARRIAVECEVPQLVDAEGVRVPASQNARHRSVYNLRKRVLLSLLGKVRPGGDAGMKSR